jgi:hypothetical protein
MRAVPNLFRVFDNRRGMERYHSAYVIRLLHANRTRRGVEACRCIRRFAKNHGRPKAGLFTFQWEVDAYEQRQLSADSMWRVLRSWDRMALGNELTSLVTDGCPRMQAACYSSMLPFFTFASVMNWGVNFLKKRSSARSLEGLGL